MFLHTYPYIARSCALMSSTNMREPAQRAMKTPYTSHSMKKNLSGIVSANLEFMRQSRGFNKTELANKAKLSLRAINYYLDGSRTPPTDSLAKLAKALSIPPAALFDEDLPDYYDNVRDAELVRKKYLKATSHQKRVILEVLKADLESPPKIPLK